MLPDESFESKQNEVCIDVSLVNFVKDDEGVFFKKVSTVDQSLQEDAIGDKDDSISWSYARGHANLIANHSFFWHLALHNSMQIKHSESTRLNAHYFALNISCT